MSEPNFKWCSYCRSSSHSDAECWCTRPVPDGLKMPGMPSMPDEAPGFHPVTLPFYCMDPAHSMPTHLFIPPGQKYVHYCPKCNHKSVAFGIVVA